MKLKKIQSKKRIKIKLLKQNYKFKRNDENAINNFTRPL
jgi:hypothetical protein